MELNDEQLMLREAVRGALEREAPIAGVRRAVDDGDRTSFSELEERQGWTGVGAPESAGGQGGGPVELVILAEELGRAAVPSPFLGRNGLLIPALLATGADELLAGVLAGERTAALLIGADAPPGHERSLAVDAGNAVSGTVRSVLDAAAADVLLVPADGALLAISAQAPEVRVSPRALADRTRELCDVTLDGAEAEPVSTSAQLDLDALAPLASALVAADALGVAGRMLDMTVSYVKEREQFGRPVGSFQAVKHLAADMLVAVETARSAVYHAAWSLSAGLESAAVHASAAKALCSEAGAEAADAALALHGAVGYTWEHDLHIFFKRAKLDVALLGPPAAHRERVALGLGLGAPAELESTIPRGGQS